MKFLIVRRLQKMWVDVSFYCCFDVLDEVLEGGGGGFEGLELGGVVGAVHGAEYFHALGLGG